MLLSFSGFLEIGHIVLIGNINLIGKKTMIKMGLNFGIEGEEGNFLFITNVLNFFSRALKDAERAILLQKDWPKGYFRKGRALAGLRVRFLLKKSIM